MNEHEAQTFLDRDTRFEGRILVTGIVRLDGYFKGDGEANGTLVIGESGIVEADLEVDRLIVHGAFTGQVRARERVEIGASGRIDGDVSTPCLCVHEGAQLNGAVKMGASAAVDEALARTGGDGEIEAADGARTGGDSANGASGTDTQAKGSPASSADEPLALSGKR